MMASAASPCRSRPSRPGHLRLAGRGPRRPGRLPRLVLARRRRARPGRAGGRRLHGRALLTEGAGALQRPRFRRCPARRRDQPRLLRGPGPASRAASAASAMPCPEALRLARLAMTGRASTRMPSSGSGPGPSPAARQALETPRGQASRAFWDAAFPGHPLAGRAAARPESLAALPSRGDPRARCAADAPGGAAGRRSAAPSPRSSCETSLPPLFAGLPAGAPPAAPPLPDFATSASRCCRWPRRNPPWSSASRACAATDPDWEASQVMLRILAGGGFTSRLMQAVREQRGLAYGIGAGLDLLFHHGIIIGSVATENAAGGGNPGRHPRGMGPDGGGGPRRRNWPMRSPT